MPHASRTGRWTSAPTADRLDDLHTAFADPEVRGIISAIGGRGAAELLPGLDLELVAANPKVFCGYSDSTVLHAAFNERANLVTFYGPSLLMELAEFPEPLAETAAGFTAAVTGSRPLGMIQPFNTIVLEGSDWDLPLGRRREPCPEPRTLRTGFGSGRLAGGCLPALCELLGTPWQPNFTDRIVLLETPQAPYSPSNAHSDLAHLVNAGLFDRAAGLVVGWPWSRDQVADLAELVARYVPGTFPVLFGLPFGHTSPMHTLPLGVEAQIEDQGLTVMGAAVRSGPPPLLPQPWA
jgi:muramoyltetrapeptide carboxypeptidase